MKIVLSGDDFRRLVAGDTVRVSIAEDMPIYGDGTAEIALADIGFGVMRAAIDHAVHEAEAGRVET